MTTDPTQGKTLAERTTRGEQKATVNRRLLDLLATATVMLLLACAASSIVAVVAVSRVHTLEQKDRDTSRATAFRLCARNASDRAFAHASMRGLQIKGAPPPRPMTRQERKLRLALSRSLMLSPYLPILDCDPNLVGLGAEPWSLDRQEQFMDRWRLGQLTGPERGICPGRAIGEPVSPRKC